jgi:primosomal protein N' (replication factor Y)
MRAYHWYIDVILPLPLPNLYTYGITGEQAELIMPGFRVTVQFGKRKNYTAIVKNVHQNKPGDFKVKGIISVLDDIPIVNLRQLRFWEWISEYYMCTIGEVFKSALPTGLKLESETRIFPVEINNRDIELTDLEMLIHSVLNESHGLTLKQLKPYSGRKDMMPVIKNMLDKGIITVEEHLKVKYKPKYKTYIRLASEFKKKKSFYDLLGKIERYPKQLSILLKYTELSKMLTDKAPVEVEKSDLLQKAMAGHSVLNTLIRKRICETYLKETGRMSEKYSPAKKSVNLNASQKYVFNEIQKKFGEKDVVLLHGVTSSGKTEIYIRLIAEQVSKKKQVLYLLPEIALTVQIIDRLKNSFGDKVGIYHSKLTASERVEIYSNVNGTLKPGQRQYQIILGVRSSIFLPFQNLGLIIVDEEHENTYKQHDPSPRYHARDAAILLASVHHAKVLLGTATPSLESYFNAQTEKYGLVKLNERYLNLEMPEIKVVDLKEVRKRKEMLSHFSPLLINSMSKALENKEQVILFQNRRGFSPYIECSNCGWVPVCRHCDVSLAYHKQYNRLVCHYCGYSASNPKSCQSCGSTSLLTRGFGTEKIEDEIAIIFPAKKVARLDLDSARRRNSYQTIISDFETGKVDILVGTQMIAKGLDFNNVKVVGILNADNMLNYPDFRSHERSYQLMAQVGGRAGRKNGRGMVIIQTSDPKNPIIRSVVHNDYESMYHDQLSERKKFNYPPFCRLINITLKHKETGILNRASDELAERLKSLQEVQTIGPEFALISRIQNMNLKNILLKLKKDASLSKCKIQIKDCINHVLSNPSYFNLKISIDVDPM